MNLDWSILWGENGLLILKGLLVTLELSAVSLVGALILGLFFGTLRWLRLKATEPLCRLYVEFSRNTPPVVQILFWYFSASVLLPERLFFGLRNLGYEFAAAVVALSVYHGGFLSEIFRAGLDAIPRGQLEAARSLGQSFPQAFRYVLLPQALRQLAPALVSEAASLIKNSSLAMAIGVTELTYQYKYIDNFQFRGIEALTAVTAIYFLLCLSVAGIGKLMSTRSRAAARTLDQRALAE
ncbi:MAG: amino acid ABC transporter permease [Variibacter sp.]